MDTESITKRYTAKPPLYYGWYIVAACFVVGLAVTGSRSAFGVFVIPLSEEFGWSRSTISLAAAIGALVGGLTQPFIGNLYDRVGARKVILSSLILVGFATIALTLTFHFLFFMFMFGVVLATAGGGTRLTGALVVRWFRRKRATAMSLTSVGTSVGSLLLVPFAMFLLQATSWRVSWGALGVITLVLAVPLAFLFLRNDPSDLGLQPDGDPDPSEDDTGVVVAQRRGPLEVDRWVESFHSLPMWQLNASYFVCGFTTLIMSVHFVPYAIDRGVSPAVGATIFGVMMGLNVVGGLGAGILADRFGRKNVLAMVYLMRGTGYMVMLLVPGTLGLWAFAAVVGFSWIATAPLTNTLTADVYGLKSLGTLTGVSFLGHQIGGFFGVLLGGFLYDLTGSYTLPFAIVGSLLFPAALSIFAIKERKYSTKYQVPSATVETSGN